MTLGIKNHLKNHLKNQPIEQSCNARHIAFEAIEKGSIPWFLAVSGFLFPESPGEHSGLEPSSSCFLSALATTTIQVLTLEDWLWLKYYLLWSLLVDLVIADMLRTPSLACVRWVPLTLPSMNCALNFSLYGLLSCNWGPASSTTLL